MFKACVLWEDSIFFKVFIMWRTMARTLRKFSLWGRRRAKHFISILTFIPHSQPPGRAELLLTLFYKGGNWGSWRLGGVLNISKFERASHWLKQRHLHGEPVDSGTASVSTELSGLLFPPSPGQWSTSTNYDVTMPLGDCTHLENSKRKTPFIKSSLSENFLCPFNFLTAACPLSLWINHPGLHNTS